MKQIFAGTHLDKPDYDAFKEDAKKEGRTVRGHLRFITRLHLKAIGFNPDGQVKLKTSPRRKSHGKAAA